MVVVDVYAPSEKGMSLFRAAAHKLPAVHDKEGQLVTDGFLDVCALVVPVIGMHRTIQIEINFMFEAGPARKTSAMDFSMQLTWSTVLYCRAVWRRLHACQE